MRIFSTLLIIFALPHSSTFAEQEQSHIFKTKTGCVLQLVVGGKTEEDIRYADAVPMAQRLAQLRLEIMKEIPVNERARRAQAALLQRAASLNNYVGQYLKTRTVHYNSAMRVLSEAFYHSALEYQNRTLNQIAKDFADWREWGGAGLPELYEGDRLDLVLANVPYDLPVRGLSAVVAIQFSDKIVTKIFRNEGGLHKVANAVATEILAGRIENNCLAVTYRSNEIAKKYSICGITEDGVFRASKITTQDLARD